MRLLATACTGLFAILPLQLIAGYPVAGLEPSKRPINAPVMTQVSRDKAWYQSSLTGVEQPYPRSLHFLDNQGNWYTPFTRPGMTGPYDIRQWHQ